LLSFFSSFVQNFTMVLIDTHCHIYLEEFDPDRANVVSEAVKEGVNRIFMPAIDSDTHEDMLKIEAEYEGSCYAMMGLHPCSVKANWLAELEIVEKYLSKRRFYALGEIGLDFYWDLTYQNEQFDVFRKQIDLALNYSIPIVIHSRNSIEECIRVVAEYKDRNLKGIFHCFTGNLDQANRILDLGFYLGIGGVVTFKNSGLDAVMANINLDQVVLETDAPYLAPVPFRGKRNECSYIKYVVQKLAEIKKISVDEVARVTTANAEKLFGVS
jgi:TatD DNase family protein